MKRTFPLVPSRDLMPSLMLSRNARCGFNLIKMLYLVFYVVRNLLFQVARFLSDLANIFEGNVESLIKKALRL